MPYQNHKNKKRNIILPAIGETVEVEVIKITDFGAFVKFSDNRRGLIHISQIAEDYVKNVTDHLNIGDKVSARVVQISGDGKIDLTLKAAKEETVSAGPKNKEFRTNVFEEKFNAYLKNCGVEQR
ncbi:MAG: RNA-binding protein S1 [Candidatus Omnitrophica bacterium CG10_big_fil_rev_8_21_14_0_10_43_8]|nr:MAG: RNA-binding protein S1 [Candidatus Omnitrophica bacterium CG10_big_fil_rev_8_21_14_0_10_43_8]